MMKVNQQITPQTLTLESARDKPEKLTREMRGNIRALEGEGNERKIRLSFSSETPYERWYGVEILDHSEEAVDLSRLEEIGCVLFNHNRDYILGRINKVWLENGRGEAEIEFDSDDEADKILQKVKSGSLKGVSVGYTVDVYEEVKANKKSSNGRFTGPCYVATRWCPLEISIVSVPADPTVGVGRAFDAPQTQHRQESLSLYEAQIQINKNLISGGRRK